MNEYEINRQTLAIIPISEEKCKVYEEEYEYIINQSIMKVIDNSCRFFGSSYEGRVEGTKKIMGISHKLPIIIEESNGVIFFPTSSPRLENCSWISLNNIENYHKSNKGTIIKFCCGKEIEIKLSFGIIDNQVLRATRLLSLLNKRMKILKENT